MHPRQAISPTHIPLLTTLKQPRKKVLSFFNLNGYNNANKSASKKPD